MFAFDGIAYLYSPMMLLFFLGSLFLLSAKPGRTLFVGFLLLLLTNLSITRADFLLSWFFLEGSAFLYCYLLPQSMKRKYLQFSFFTFLCSILGLIFFKMDWILASVLLLLFGITGKMGFPPFASSLPEIYEKASAPVVLWISTLQFTSAVILLIRFLQQFPNYTYLLIPFSLCAILLATIYLVSCDSVRRLIGYISLLHAGFIGLALGINSGFSLRVALLYTVGSLLIKSSLLFSTFHIEEKLHQTKILHIRGLLQTMPITGFLFMLATFAQLGFFPFASFFEEYSLLQAFYQGGHEGLFYFTCIILLLAFMAIGKAFFPMIWGTAKNMRAYESYLKNIPAFLCLAALILLGIAQPNILDQVLQQILTELGKS